jgi:hypothetical protein
MIFKPLNILNKYNKNNFLFLDKKYNHTIYSNKTSIIYIDSLSNKAKILKENKDKSGIYR